MMFINTSFSVSLQGLEKIKASMAEILQAECDRQVKDFLESNPELRRNGTYTVSIIIPVRGCSSGNITVIIRKQRLQNKETGASVAFQAFLMPRICTVRSMLLSFLSRVACRRGKCIRQYIELLGEFSVSTYYRWRKRFITWWNDHIEIHDLLHSITGMKTENYHEALAAINVYIGTEKGEMILSAFDSFNA